MDTNQKKFNTYVFLSTFSRNLIEVFIPLILFKYGYPLKDVILYFLIMNTISLLISYPCIMFSKKYDNKILSIVGILAFVILQIMLNNVFNSTLYLIIIACLFAIYRRCYWIARRYYTLKVMPKENISKSYSIISIFNQLGTLTAAYIGALLLDFVNITTLTVISISLFLISLIPLYLLKFKHVRSNTKIELINTFKKIPWQNLYLFGTYELINVVKFLIPLYLFIYVKDNYQVVGILNLLANLATVIFAYLYGKKINNEKNFLKLSIILVTIIFILKCNTTSILLIAISFLEGIFTKMYEISMGKEFCLLSKKLEYENYNAVYEFTQNTFRLFVTIIIYYFINDLKVMIYVPLLFILAGIFLNFKHLDIEDYDIDSEKK